jgi:hypothetical protein
VEIDAELGIDLWDRIEHRLGLVQRFPHTGKLIEEVPGIELRHHFLDRFEYALVLAIEADAITVVAFHHQRRDPEYWKPRLAKVQP